MAAHRINNLEVELTTGELALAETLLERIAQLHERRIAPILDRIFTDLSPPGRLDRLDRLELDLGELPEGDFDDAFIHALEAEVRTALARALGEHSSNRRSDVARELLTIFARTGNLPWWSGDAEDPDDPVAAALSTMSRDAPRDLLTLLHDLADDPPALARLARHCDESTLAPLLAHRWPAASAELLAAARWLAHPPGADPPPRTSPRPALLAALARDLDTPQAVLRSLLSDLAVALQTPERSLLPRLARLAHAHDAPALLREHLAPHSRPTATGPREHAPEDMPSETLPNHHLDAPDSAPSQSPPRPLADPPAEHTTSAPRLAPDANAPLDVLDALDPSTAPASHAASVTRRRDTDDQPDPDAALPPDACAPRPPTAPHAAPSPDARAPRPPTAPHVAPSPAARAPRDPTDPTAAPSPAARAPGDPTDPTALDPTAAPPLHPHTGSPDPSAVAAAHGALESTDPRASTPPRTLTEPTAAHEPDDPLDSDTLRHSDASTASAPRATPSLRRSAESASAAHRTPLEPSAAPLATSTPAAPRPSATPPDPSPGPGSPRRASPAPRPSPPPPLPPAVQAARRRALAQLDELYLDDAGLVILWPFLARLFERMGLLDDKRRFTGPLAQMRGVALLAYLAREDSDPPEFLLPLAKLLCGLAPEVHFNLPDPLDPDHLAECDHFLAAVIDHAPVLRDMSVPGFRATFLRRRAVLAVRDGAWLLRVERAAHDIVLERFPWSWSWLKLPWMPDPLRVEW